MVVTALIVVIINALTLDSYLVDVIALVVATAYLIEKYATRPIIKRKK